MLFAEFYVDWADTCNYVIKLTKIRQKKYGQDFHASIQLVN